MWLWMVMEMDIQMVGKISFVLGFYVLCCQGAQGGRFCRHVRQKSPTRLLEGTFRSF